MSECIRVVMAVVLFDPLLLVLNEGVYPLPFLSFPFLSLPIPMFSSPSFSLKHDEETAFRQL